MTSALLSSILAQENGGNPLSLLIILIPMGAILYMTIVPQRKQRQKQAAMLARIDVGDEVVTNGGIIGIVTFVEDELYHLEVDTDVVIRVSRSAIAGTAKEPDDSSSQEPPSRTRKGLLGGVLGNTDGESASESAGSTKK